MAVIKRVSLVDQVYDKLRDRIVNFKIPFGSKLNVSKLQEEFGVSSTPVREALNRLLNDGLIEFENNVGARVIDVNAEDVQQFQELVFATDMAAARYAMKRGSRPDMAKEIYSYIEDYRNSNGIAQSCDCIRNIKSVFYKNSGNALLNESMQSMTGMDEILHALFSMPREKGGSGGYYHSGITYFEKIYDAVMENDFAKVCDALEEHMIWARKYILKNLETVKERQNHG